MRMKLPDILSLRARADRNSVLAASGFLIATIAVADAILHKDISLGFLYLIPVLLAALFIGRKGLLLLSILCVVLRELLGPFEFGWDTLVRTFFGLVAYFGCGLFVIELARRRRAVIENLRQVEEQQELRRAAEEQLRVLVETSPAGIIAVDGDGIIRIANRAVHQVFGAEGEALTGQPIGAYLPVLAGVPQAEQSGRVLHTTLECRGRRKNGEVFLAHVWLSTYMTPGGPCLAAIVLDTSDDLRDREELGLQRLLSSSRVLVRAVSHEIRNLCAGIAVVHANLRRIPGITASEDFQALGTLVEGLGRLVSSDLRPATESGPASVDLREILDELRIIIEPALDEEEIKLRWKIEENLPPAFADRHGLLHVFMNLVNNSSRAMRGGDLKELTVEAKAEAGRIVVRFSDTGPGVQKPELLFKAFQHSAEGSGLGLYLSRALVRSFAGELRHEPSNFGCCFAVELAAMQSRAEAGS